MYQPLDYPGGVRWLAARPIEPVLSVCYFEHVPKQHNQPLGAIMDEIISRCGYCGDVIDYCQGHGEDERKAFGFEIDSDEYEKRREEFEADGLQAALNRAAMVLGPMIAEDLRRIG